MNNNVTAGAASPKQLTLYFFAVVLLLASSYTSMVESRYVIQLHEGEGEGHNRVVLAPRESNLNYFCNQTVDVNILTQCAGEWRRYWLEAIDDIDSDKKMIILSLSGGCDVGTSHPDQICDVHATRTRLATCSSNTSAEELHVEWNYATQSFTADTQSIQITVYGTPSIDHACRDEIEEPL